MNSTSGARPTPCKARMRSAAKMKLPLSTATTSSRSGAAALICSARARLRVAMLSASNSTRSLVAAMRTSAHPGNEIVPGEEADRNVAAIGRRGCQPGAERQRFAWSKSGAGGQRRPGINLLRQRIAQGESQARHLDGGPGHVDDRAFDHQ